MNSFPFTLAVRTLVGGTKLFSGVCNRSEGAGDVFFWFDAAGDFEFREFRECREFFLFINSDKPQRRVTYAETDLDMDAETDPDIDAETDPSTDRRDRIGKLN